jgi:2-C-methyl-D-erythritol 4-phosphate cytidylyltransferase
MQEWAPDAERIWFVVPAAGASRRMASDSPKQYLRIGGRTILEHALAPLLARTDLAGGVVTLAADDSNWPGLPEALRARVAVAPGGAERCESVLSGLRALAGAREGDWVLVHDAARPCLDPADLERLIAECRQDPIGGLLAVPLADTLKRGDEGARVLETVPREGLWRAQTPQMFRCGRLVQALEAALAAGERPTDEAAVIERLGLRPRLVRGSPLNVKVTLPEDLAFAASVLDSRAGGAP